MSNREKVLWCTAAGRRVFLFLLSSTDLIIKEKKREVYPISVIVEDTNDEYYANFKKGMDKAAEKYQADVNFITLYQADNEEEQMEMMQREIKDGARAVVLAPVNESGSIMRIDEISPNCPVILLGSTRVNDSVAASISVNGYETGRELAEQAVKEESLDNPVWIFTEGLSYTGNTDLYDGVRSVLDEMGFSYRLVERKNEDTYRQAIEETVYPDARQAAIIAMDAKSLDEASDIIGGSTVYAEHVTGLYGIGCNTAILRKMDRGLIKGIMAVNDYDEGYLCIRTAVEAIQGMWLREQMFMESYYITGEDLRERRYEKLLYPME